MSSTRQKLNEIEVYLLEHWEDIMSLKEAIKNLDTKVASFGDLIVSSLKEQEWWTEEFRIKPTKNEIHVFKNSWKVGKGEWDFVCIGFWGLTLDDLLGASDEPATVYVWSEQLKEKKNEFRKKFESYSEKIRETKKIKMSGDEDDNYPLYVYLPRTSQEWTEIIKAEKFVEEIVSYFNNSLVPLIDPIDRALAEVLGKKRVKK